MQQIDSTCWQSGQEPACPICIVSILCILVKSIPYPLRVSVSPWFNMILTLCSQKGTAVLPGEQSSMTTAILLAGGAGRKFWPFAEVRNKCAFPIANVPIVRRLADQLLVQGCSRLLVVTGPHAGSVRSALAGLEEHTRFIAQPE